jgi:hypothetical protein
MSEKRVLAARVISRMRPGPDMDKLVAHLLFDIKAEGCTNRPGAYHIVGSMHLKSKVSPRIICSSPLPDFSTGWEHLGVLMEWMVDRFPCVEVVWDCDKWGCNTSGLDGGGRWVRLSSAAGSKGMQEAVCKAAMLSIVNPQNSPMRVEKARKRRAKRRR